MIDEVVELAPLLMEMLGLVGAVVSVTVRVIESEELEETLPTASFNQR